MAEIINPYLRLPDHPNYLRRAKHHDYCRPARYLITIHKSETTSTLSTITGSVKHPEVLLTPTGESLQEVIIEWPHKYPQLAVMKHVIMPDHVHLCVDVHAYLPRTLGRAVASLMGAATNALECSLCEHHNTLPPQIEHCGAHKVSTQSMPFFKKGFNDRIAYNIDQWYRQLAYVDDNPRRYLLKQLYPDFFRRRWCVCIDDWQYMAIGNVNLLKNPDLQQVRFSSKYAPGVFENKIKQWQRCIENNGVLVSPFIHPKENALQKQAIDEGGAVIRICENGFAERFAPQGRDFDLAVAGRLLLIAPIEHNTHREFLSYAKAQSLNAVAERIVSTNWLNGRGRIRLWS